MSSFVPRPLRVFNNLWELMQTPAEPPRNKFYSYCKNEDLIGPIKDSINIVMSRDIRKNVRIAADMAVGMAKMFPNETIVYLNTYAGLDLLQQAFTAAFEVHDIQMLAPVTVDGKQTFPTLPNLHIYDCPYGYWKTAKFVNYLKELVTPIVIVNSFEYATLSRTRRMVMAEDLVEMRGDLGLTLVVFTHEKKNDVRPGYPARGAIGILSGKAMGVCSLKDEYERLQETKLAAKEAAKIEQSAARAKASEEKALKQAQKRVVHENKTRENLSKARTDDEDGWTYVTDYTALRKQWAEEEAKAEEPRPLFWVL